MESASCSMSSEQHSNRYYPPDIEPVPDDDEFMVGLADLVDEHADDEEEKYRYFCACVEFGQYWKADFGGWE